MSFLRALKRLGAATVDVVLLPVDTIASVIPALQGEQDTPVERRCRKIAEEVAEAHEETFE